MVSKNSNLEFSYTKFNTILLVGTIVLFSLVIFAGLATGSVSASEGGQVVLDAEDGPAGEQEIDRGDWYVHITVELKYDGTALLTKEVVGDDHPEEPYFTYANGKFDSIVEGEEAITDNDDHLVLDTSVSNEFTMEIELGNMDRPINTGVFDNEVLFAVRELFPYQGAYDQGEYYPDHYRVTVDAPDGWDVAAPGEQVSEGTFELLNVGAPETFPRGMIIAGEFEKTTIEPASAKYTIVEMDAASPDYTVDDVAELFEQTAPWMEDGFDTGETSDRVAIIGPAGHERGGIAQGTTVLVNEEEPLYDVTASRSTFVHEQAHIYQLFREYGNDRYDGEGQASYVQTLALYETGVIDSAEFREMLQIWITKDRTEIGDPLDVSAEVDEYFKGAAVYAAIDIELRAQTNGDKDITDVLTEVADQSDRSDVEWDERYAIPEHAVKEVMEELTGEDYTAFFETYAAGSETPPQLLQSDFSLDDLEPIEQDLDPEAALEAEVQQLEERNEELEEQVSEYEDEIEELENEIADLEAELDEKDGESVEIDISVEPESGETFTTETPVVVSARDVESLSSEVRIRIDGVETTLGEDGEETIDINTEGEHELLIEYDGETETQPLTVVAEEDADTDSSETGERTDDADDTGSGFTLISGVVALFASIAAYVLLVKRRY